MIHWIQDIFGCLLLDMWEFIVCFAFSKVIIYNKNRSFDLAKFSKQNILAYFFFQWFQATMYTVKSFCTPNMCIEFKNQCNWLLNALMDKHRGKLCSTVSIYLRWIAMTMIQYTRVIVLQFELHSRDDYLVSAENYQSLFPTPFRNAMSQIYIN